VVLQRKRYTSDVEDVVITHFIKDTINVPVVVSQSQKEENILG
jgi:hypothetical protein